MRACKCICWYFEVNIEWVAGEKQGLFPRVSKHASACGPLCNSIPQAAKIVVMASPTMLTHADQTHLCRQAEMNPRECANEHTLQHLMNYSRKPTGKSLAWAGLRNRHINSPALAGDSTDDTKHADHVDRLYWLPFQNTCA